ncbi:MAG: hypothetical protein HJJLKODD_00075 [Phycisphaerae bacterium]|nr:hypothetical protein [Phycisphaerae bacterium]
MSCGNRPRFRSVHHAAIICGWSVLTLSFSTGCTDVLNQSFLDIFDLGDGAASSFAAVDAPTGHIPIRFSNLSRIADDVFTYLIQGDVVPRQEVIDEIRRVNPQLNEDEITNIIQQLINNATVDLEVVQLPPRVRMTVDVTNVDGGVQRLEFVNGLRLVRGDDQFGDIQTDLPPDLRQNTNDSFIVQCDIASIEIIQVEVFVPVVIQFLQTENIDIGGGVIDQVIRCVGAAPPHFEILEADQNFNTGIGGFGQLRNYDPRNFPPPLTTVNCGAVVILELTGDLTLPFEDVPQNCRPTINPRTNIPGYFLDTAFGLDQALRIPGRYGVAIRVLDQ